jgi:hypothetical protein
MNATNDPWNAPISAQTATARTIATSPATSLPSGIVSFATTTPAMPLM